MLLKEKSRQLAAHLSFSEGRRVSVFLAPQVALVFQVGGSDASPPHGSAV
jgi:hypothetical protein